MNAGEFDYALPPGLIAQAPSGHRDRSRLLRLGRHDGSVVHQRFDALPELLEPGDLLVFNDTRVRAARLTGRKLSGGGVELLLVEPLPDGSWRALLRASRPTAAGTEIEVAPGLRARVVERTADDWRLEFDGPEAVLSAALARCGALPLPPYIERAADDPRTLLDRERYQTIYAREPGAVAAPTAGLHFTHELLERLAGRGVRQAYLTLHVGPGTFLPVRAARIEEHRMHAESFSLPAAVAAEVAGARKRGGRVVAVGSTVVRTLEARALEHGGVAPGAGRCGLFIYPGFRFRVVDAMITNFHLPRSTLLMLVAAFAGRERLLQAYAEAIDAGYRFYSYGDAMLVIDR